jgi:hypothetical protein
MRKTPSQQLRALKQAGYSNAEISVRVGIRYDPHGNTIYRWIHGRQRPTAARAQAIDRLFQNALRSHLFVHPWHEEELPEMVGDFRWKKMLWKNTPNYKLAVILRTDFKGKKRESCGCDCSIEFSVERVKRGGVLTALDDSMANEHNILVQLIWSLQMMMKEPWQMLAKSVVRDLMDDKPALGRRIEMVVKSL